MYPYQFFSVINGRFTSVNKYKTNGGNLATLFVTNIVVGRVVKTVRFFKPVNCEEKDRLAF